MGSAIDSGLQEGLDIDVDVFPFSKEVEVAFDGGGEGRNDDDFYFFVGELVLERVVLFVSIGGELSVHKSGITLYFFGVAGMFLGFVEGG